MPIKSGKKIRLIATAVAIGLAVEIIGSTVPALSLVSQAEARIGQPWTPRSAAGVARRTTAWRVLKHTTAWVATLPTGCVRTKVNGFDVWRCGGTY